jgi:hypothetical protein
MNAAHISLLQKVYRGELSFWSALSRVQPRLSVHRDNPYLCPEAAYNLWKKIFQGEPAASDSPPHPALSRIYSHTITRTITSDMFLAALCAMKPSAPGPDGLIFEIVWELREELAPHAALAFTKGLKDGIPEALRVAETLLFPKTKTPSERPEEYRPITLLPIMIRILHKIIDTEVRRHILGDPNAPLHERVDQCRLFLGQSGFQKRRSAHDNAFFLHILLNAQHTRASHNTLYAAFLDIHKAFDSLDHGHLLDMFEHNIGLDSEWLEIIRRLLRGNTTRVQGRLVKVLIGAFQGSPLSPLFCLVYLDDLARDLAAFLRDHPIAFPLQHVCLPGLQQHQLLLLLLLFADDVLALGLSINDLRAILTRIGAWATRRRLKLSPKSILAVLAGSQEVPPTLPMMQVKWYDEPFLDYLGIPYRTYRPHWHSYAPFPIDTQTLSSRIACIRTLFHTPKGQRIIHVPSLISSMQQTVLGKALYPTAVVDIDYAALDTLVYEALRTLLQLPKCTPTVLVRWELGLMPSRLAGYRLALRYIARFVQFSPIYHFIIAPITRHRPAGGISALFSKGPLKRFLDIIEYPVSQGRTIGDILLPGLEDSYSSLTLISRLSIHDWNTRVDRAIATAFTTWAKQELARMPPCYHAHLTLALDLSPPHTRRRPQYIYTTGDRARAGLRFKVPFLRYFHDRSKDLPTCVWCNAANSEQGLHLLTCPNQPATVAASFAAARAAILAEAGGHLSRSPTALTTALLRLQWRRQQPATALRTIGAMSHAINSYAQDVGVAANGRCPITEVRTMELTAPNATGV